MFFYDLSATFNKIKKAVVLLLSISSCVGGWAEKSEPYFDDPHHIEDLLYGDILFDYYSKRNLHAIVKAKDTIENKKLKNNLGQTQALLTQLYLNYGLNDLALSTLLNIDQENLSEEFTNNIFLQLAQIAIDQENWLEAIDHLKKISDKANISQKYEKHLTLIQLQIKSGQLEAAEKLSHILNVTNTDNAYLQYLHIATRLRFNETQKNIGLLMDLLKTSDSTLSDHINLKLGLIYIEKKQYKISEAYFDNINKEGALGNAALYYLSAANTNDNPDLALEQLNHLLKNNANNYFVQRAYLSKAQLFDKNSAYKTAYQNYNKAIDFYNKKISELNNFQQTLKDGHWFQQFTPQTLKQIESYQEHQLKSPWITFKEAKLNQLYDFYGSDNFTINQKNLWQTGQIAFGLRLNEHRLKQYKNILIELEKRITRQLTISENEIDKQYVYQVYHRYFSLENDYYTAKENYNFLSLPSGDQYDSIIELNKAKTILKNINNSPYFNHQREVVDRLQRLLEWDLYYTSPERLWRTKETFNQVKSTLDEITNRITLIEQIKEVKKSFKTNQNRINKIEQKLKYLKKQSAYLLAQQQDSLKETTDQFINSRKDLLESFKAEATFALINLMDRIIETGAEKND